MTFEDIKNEIRTRYDNAKNGYYNCIPFTLDRLNKYVPGIIPGEYYLVTGSSGSAKSKITRFLFIHEPYQYVLQNPDCKLDILYWSLEEDPKKIYMMELSRLLKTRFNKIVSYRKLLSIGKDNVLDGEILDLIDELEPEFNQWKEHIHIFGAMDSNPTGIMNRVSAFAYKIGRYYHKDGSPYSDEEMMLVKQGKCDFRDISCYKTDHPRHFVIVIIDHISLCNLESGLSIVENIYRLSSDYLLKIKNRFGFIPVIVQQQNSQKEKMQFTSSGTSIDEKLEPTLDSLANCTTTQREATIAFGIFGPARYGIPNHMGYDITILKDNYRSLRLLKQRDDKANIALPLLFHGEADLFRTLPNNQQDIARLYEQIKRMRNG